MHKENLPNLPENWRWVKLSEISQINPTLDISNLKEDNEYSFIPMENVEEETGNIDIPIVRKLSELKKGYKRFINGDIIFAKITPCMENGKIAIVDNLKNDIGFGSTEFHVIRLREELPRKYYFYFLLQQYIRADAQRHMTGTVGHLRVPTKYMEDLKLPFPPINQQFLIVEKIEELFNKLDVGINSMKQVKTQLEIYRQAILKYAFEGKLTQEWREKNKDNLEPASILLEKVKSEQYKNSKKKVNHINKNENIKFSELPRNWIWTNLATLIMDGPKNGLYKSKDFYGNGYPILRIDDFQNDGFLRSRDELKKIEITENEYLNFQLNPGDLVINRVNSMSHLGKSIIIPKKLCPVILESNMMKMKLTDRINSKYVLYYLRSPMGRLSLIKNAKQAVNQASINQNDVKQTYLPLPPLIEQFQIIEILDRYFSVILNIRSNIQNILSCSRFLKNSILNKAFQGTLKLDSINESGQKMILKKIQRSLIDYS